MKFYMNLVLKRFLTLSITGVAIMSLAAGCSFPGIENPLTSLTGEKDNAKNVDFGILKHDPQIKDVGFGKINMLKNGVNGEDLDGLVNSQVVKMEQLSKDNWIAFSLNRGIFTTQDGGRSWERKYLIPIENKNPKEKQQAMEYNNLFVYRGFFVRNNGKEIFISGQSPNDKLAKIFKSIDGGNSFKQVYTEVTANTAIRRIVADANKPNTLYAVQTKEMIYSRDNGETWSRWFNTENLVAEMGNFKDNKTYAITQNGIVYWLSDEGNSAPVVTKKYLTNANAKKSEEINYFGNKVESSTSGQFSQTTEKMAYIEQAKNNNNEYILITDSNIWMSKNGLDSKFEKLSLPTVVEPNRLITAAIDPKLGLQHMIVSVNNKIYETHNYGQSWQTPQNLGLSVAVGNIAVLKFDKNDTRIIYAGLSK